MRKRTLTLLACVLALTALFALMAFAADDISVGLAEKLSVRGIEAT